MAHEETITVDSDSVTVEVVVDTQFGESRQTQTVSTSPGDEVTVRIEEE